MQRHDSRTVALCLVGLVGLFIVALLLARP